MKPTLLTGVFLMFWSVTTAQVRPEAFIGKLPSVPGNVCSTDHTKAKDEFMAKLDEIRASLQNELDRRKKNSNAKSNANNQQMMSNTVKKSGVSPELIQQLMALEKQKKGATGDQKKAIDAQIKAITDQLIQQKMNISSGEIDNLKKTNAAGQKAWATGYTAEMNAGAMADPKKLKDENAKNMEKYKLQARQKQLGDSLKAQQNKYMKKFVEIDEDEAGKKLLAKIEGIRSEIAKNENLKIRTTPDQNKVEALRDEMYKAKISYCNLQSPKYINVLAEYKSFIQSSMAAYYRLEQLTNEVMKMQTGVDNSIEPGEYGLGNVSSYIKQLLDAYKYNLCGPEDLTIG